MPKRIFVSHSSHDDKARRFLIEVCEALDAAGFDVLVDYKCLPVADEWESHLHGWLAECDAAVLLLGSDALKNSVWVLKEATILTWRARVDEHFRVLPVWLEQGLSEMALQNQYWRAVGINALQAES